MATHSSILAWKILCMEESGRLQSMGLQRVGHDWATSLHVFLLNYQSFNHATFQFFSLYFYSFPTPFSYHVFPNFFLYMLIFSPSRVFPTCKTGRRGRGWNNAFYDDLTIRPVFSSLKQNGPAETLPKKSVRSGEELYFSLQLKEGVFVSPVEVSGQMTFHHEKFSFTIDHISLPTPHALVLLLLLV